MSTPHIVILGSGFAALTAIRELRKRDRKARITTVAYTV
jgi:sulfide:quinone oxidoreductase